ncbi:MAG TPA: GTPase HflX [Bacteroidales bacterium]|nr:GTPase HflX [Bacteroidales bacterium]HQI69111.1 GTPase HflX [Bacteroidales bacterium]
MNTPNNNKERAILIGLITLTQNKEKALLYLDELSFLLKTAGGEVAGKFLQKIDRPDPKSYVGSGKIEEIRNFIQGNNINLAVFDDELSPSQIRNIETALKCRVIDRNNLILDIFAFRARTSYARTQVELAQYQYLLPRLTGMWTHLEKQRGGIGLKGPGEKEIETDRRVIKDRIALLKEKLKKIDKQKITQRKNRKGMIRVALVGYTNTGKSTIMNLLSKSDVFAEDRLFATLDTTVRKVVIGNLPFLLSDTVGFIRKLPHALIESFKSTLDEVFEADVLIHVVDISHPEFEEQMEVVNQTLAEIGANDKPVITVFNKIDNYSFEAKDEDDLSPSSRRNVSLTDLQQTWMGKISTPSVFISALHKTHVEDFKSLIYERVKTLHAKIYPYDNFLY